MKHFRIPALLLCLVALTASAGYSQETAGAKGKVRGVRGETLAGTTVTARRDGKDVRTAKTDSKGAFEMTGLAPGTYNFVFEKSGYGAGLRPAVELKAGKVTDLGDRLILSVDQGTLVLIRGSVFNEDGRSVTGAKVEIERIGADNSTKKLGSGYTNVSGEFSFRQPEGEAKIRVTASLRGASATKEIEVNSAGVYRLALTLNLKE